MEAEKLRVAAETGRIEAESLRVTAEEERVAAETKREEGFNKFEGKINANTKELKAARSATTGEKFNTLDERIDCEINRLNKKIEVSFLQQEDKGKHVIENTVEGMTTDMVIKGRTLQNFKSNVKNYISKWVDNGDNYSLNLPSGSGQPYILYGLTQTLKENQKYTVIVNLIEYTSGALHFSFMNSEGNKPASTELVAESKGLKKFVFTINNTIKAETLRILPRNGVDNIYSISKNILILEGDWTNKPIPEYFEGIKSFGQEEDKISILSNGSNLLYNIFSVGSCSNNGNDFVKNSNKANFNENKFEYVGAVEKFTRKAVIFKHKFKPNENYTLNISSSSVGSESIWGWFLDDNLKVVSGQEPFYLKSTSGSSTILSKQSYNYFMITFSTTLYNTNLEFYNEMILTESNTVKNFKPPIFNKKDILLQNLGFDEGLRGLNLTVYDELNNIRNVAIKRIDKYKLTGEEEIYTEETIAENNMKFVITTRGTSVKPSGSVISDNFIKGNDTVSNSVRLATNNKVIINIDKTKLSEHSVEGFKTWLKANPTTIYYELAEPAETPLDENISLKTFGERTYVSFENAISGTSSFKAPVNTVATISRLNRENRALEEENKNLRQDFESTTLSLTDSDLELVKQNVDIDFRLMEVEFALDIPQSTLSSNINFKKKGEVKSMARTPYEMLKIVILSGDYDREDYIHKVGKYYERGRMTKEEYDELMSLMTADEVIGG